MLQLNVRKEGSRSSKVHLPLISLSAEDQFHRNITSFIRSAMSDAPSYVPNAAPGLNKIPPYWYPYTTMAKERWLGRELLEVVSTEFRDRSMEYYVRVLCVSFGIVANNVHLLAVCIRIRRNNN
jgi:hypothetical protein